MTPSFRVGFGGGLVAAVIVALVWHWQPERQVRLHSEHFIARVQEHAWTRISAAVAIDYSDAWSPDRAIALERLREMMTLLRGVEIITANESAVETADREGTWTARITLRGGGEYAAAVVDRVNALQMPFVLRWRKQSTKPWDWQLVSVSQPELKRPDGGP